MTEQQPLNEPVKTVPPPYPGEPGNYGQPPPPNPYQGSPYPQPGQPQPGYAQPGGVMPPPGGVMPPPGGVVPPPVATTVVVQQNFGQFPATCVCPNCHHSIVTRLEYETGLFTWLMVGVIFIFGGWIFCLCLIPFCVDSLKDVRHVCPNCNHTISVCKRM